MLLFDLHFHANVNLYRNSRFQRNWRLNKHRKHFIETGVDFVASTEHAFKNPLDAYLYLADATSDLDTTIIPGVEWISSEGIEAIFLFDSEGSLRDGLKRLEPFKRSIFDIGEFKDDPHMISVIPHPFCPGKTGVATILGQGAFLKLLEMVDYVEIHNGLSLHFMKCNFVLNNFLPEEKMKQVQYTFALPAYYRYDELGWAVGSDAHFPKHQHIVGGVYTDTAREDWFQLLKSRVHFEPVMISQLPHSRFGNYHRLLKTGRCVLSECMIKNNLIFAEKWL